MREHIYTIPINDAFDTDCECPVCQFMKNEEKQLIEYTLGASMMEPDERLLSNAEGYCKHHFSMLLNEPNKLSLALILETHLAEIRKCIEVDKDAVVNSKKGIFSKDNTIERCLDKYDEFVNGCVICHKHDKIEEKFVDNIIELYKKEEEFRSKFKKCKGFCVPHFAKIVKHAKKVLSGEKLTEFYKTVYEIEISNLSRVQEDITWFTKKFDFRFADEDWKNSRDAVPRTTEKVIGYVKQDEK